VVRFRVPENKAIVFTDLVRGTVNFDSAGIGDFVIVKSDGIPVYNYAVVLDDALMHITHVIRAEEHLSNTPRQILIYEALGLPLPAFGHISLILGKGPYQDEQAPRRHAVEQYRSLGYLPEALVNFLALLGWAPEGEEEIFSREELIRQFSLDRVAKNPAVFDVDKLNWLTRSTSAKPGGCHHRPGAAPTWRRPGTSPCRWPPKSGLAGGGGGRRPGAYQLRRPGR
jgi:nondiscriminating glutamyl-tRNA synthetase